MFLAIEFFAFIAIGMTSTSLGFQIDENQLLIGMYIFNLIPAWYISRAAKSLSKNPWIYGGLSVLGFGIALPVWSILYMNDYLSVFSHIFGRKKK